jgi:hypothetical protein
LCARRCVDLVLQHGVHDLGVGAVHHQLEALAGERVVDRVEAVVERQQPVAPGGLGQRHEQVHPIGQVGRVALQRLAVEHRDPLHRLHARARQRGAERPPEHDQRRRQVEERRGGGAFQDGANHQQAEAEADADQSCGLAWTHQSPSRPNGGKPLAFRGRAPPRTGQGEEGR